MAIQKSSSARRTSLSEDDRRLSSTSSDSWDTDSDSDTDSSEEEETTAQTSLHNPIMEDSVSDTINEQDLLGQAAEKDRYFLLKISFKFFLKI